MKAYQSLKYLVVAGALGFWGCSSQQLTQNTEYDDLYFSSKDREQATLTASVSNKNYAAIENKGESPLDNSQKNVNPEYIQQYAEEGRRDRDNTGTNNTINDSYEADGDGNAYYDEDYNRRPIDLARDYNRYQSGTNINVFPNVGFGGMYSSGAFYDPFYDPFYSYSHFDPYFRRPFFGRPGWNVNISYNYGWGNPWGWGRPMGAYWHDPFYSGFAYSPWGHDPFFYNGFYPRSYYGGWNGGGWNGGNNVVIVNPGNNNDSRQTRYSPRSSRSSSVVNNDFDNTPRTNRSGRDGRVDYSAGAGTNPSGNTSTDNNGRRPANISTDENRPARAIRPRSNANPDYQPQNNQPNQGNSGRNYSTPADVNNSYGGSNDGNSTRPRAVRPRGNSDDSQNNRGNDYYNSPSNRPSAPTYSSPSPSRSSRTNDNWSSPSNNSTSPRSSGGYDNNSRGSYSSPSPSSPSSSPRSGSSNGGSGSSPRRSPR